MNHLSFELGEKKSKKSLGKPTHVAYSLHRPGMLTHLG
jgi:hypothetical protein